MIWYHFTAVKWYHITSRVSFLVMALSHWYPHIICNKEVFTRQGELSYRKLFWYTLKVIGELCRRAMYSMFGRCLRFGSVEWSLALKKGLKCVWIFSTQSKMLMCLDNFARNYEASKDLRNSNTLSSHGIIALNRVLLFRNHIRSRIAFRWRVNKWHWKYWS